MRIFKRFTSDQSGATALIFGLAALPLIGAVGGAVDYSRAAAEQSKLQRATDATVLALTREPKTATARQLQDRANLVFASTYQPSPGVAMADPVVIRTDDTIALSRSGSITNAFMQTLGIRQTAVTARATAALGRQQIELALVLDNTGSMNDQISGQRKIDALKSAALKLLSDLRAVAAEPETVKVSIVPFDTEIRVDPATYRNKDWIRWTDPSSAQERNAWTGYIIDRYSPYDIGDQAPAMALAGTLYPKLQTSQWAANGQLTTLRPLTSLYDTASYQAVTSTVSAMAPRGNTNVGLGISWGTATLTRSVPLGVPVATSPGTVKRFMVVLTDGTNTQKWVDGSAKTVRSAGDAVNVMIDDRTRQACDTAKDSRGAAIELFTIRLLDGDAALLKGCATDASHYFDVQSSAQLSVAFQSIVNAITSTRLTN